MKQFVKAFCRHLYKAGLLALFLLLYSLHPGNTVLAQSFPTFTPTPGPATNTPVPQPTNTPAPLPPSPPSTNTPAPPQPPTNTPAPQLPGSTATPTQTMPPSASATPTATTVSQTAAPTITITPDADEAGSTTAVPGRQTDDDDTAVDPTIEVEGEIVDTQPGVDASGPTSPIGDSIATPAALATDPGGSSSDWLPLFGIGLILAGITAALIMRRR